MMQWCDLLVSRDVWDAMKELTEPRRPIGISSLGHMLAGVSVEPCEWLEPLTLCGMTERGCVIVDSMILATIRDDWRVWGEGHCPDRKER